MEKGITKKPHAISTNNNIRGLKTRLKKYAIPPGSTPGTIFITHGIYRKIFVQSEVDDLDFDTVMLMFVLRILDDASEPDIKSAEEIFCLRVRVLRKSMKLRFEIPC